MSFSSFLLLAALSSEAHSNERVDTLLDMASTLQTLCKVEGHQAPPVLIGVAGIEADVFAAKVRKANPSAGVQIILLESPADPVSAMNDALRSSGITLGYLARLPDNKTMWARRFGGCESMPLATQAPEPPSPEVPELVRAASIPENSRVPDHWSVRDSLSTRYLLSPSAFTLPDHSVVISQRELLLTSFAIAVGPNLTVNMGTSFPLFALSALGHERAFGGCLGAKAGAAVSPWLHVAAGAELIAGLSDSESGAIAIPYGLVTLGDTTTNVSFFGAYLMDGVGTASVSGFHEMGRSWGLVGEAWLASPSPLVVPVALAFRSLPANGRFSVDAGAIFTRFQGEIPLALPWVNLSWVLSSK